MNLHISKVPHAGGKTEIRIFHTLGSNHTSMTPEEAVSFAVKLSNLAYPLTKPVQAASLRGKPKVSEKYTDIPQPVYREPQFGTPCGYTAGHCAARGFAAADFILEDDFIYWRNK